MSSFKKSDLHLNWASYQAAQYACGKWHYSKSMPTGKLIKIGVWEKEKFVGCVIFSRGSNYCMPQKYGLTQKTCCELTRVALASHRSPVSRIVSIAFAFLKKSSPSIQLVVSYADPYQNHHGGIYQAGNWIYVGTSGSSYEYYYRGRWVHSKVAYEAHKYDPNASKSLLESRIKEGKHIYLMPLNSQMKKKALSLAQPYPMRSKQVQVSPTDTDGGAAPTRTLQKLT